MPIRITGMNSGLDTEALVSELVSAYRTKEQKYEKAQKKLSWKQDAWKSLNTKVKNFYDNISNLRFTSAWSAKKTTASDTTKATVTAGTNAANGTHSLKITRLAKGSYITGGALQLSDQTSNQKVSADTTLAELGYTGSGESIEVKDSTGAVVKTIAVSETTKISEIVSGIGGVSNVNASFDATNQRIFASAKETGTANAFSLDGSAAVLQALGLSDAGGAKTITAQDSEIELDGATYTSATNRYSINGLNIECLAESGNSEVSITTSTDTQAIYDQIKEFFSEYNSLMQEMSKLYNAASARGYEPLTSEEKDAMTDTEVEEWEKKIKSALLRRDDTLDGVMSSMKNAMSSSYYMYGGNAVTYDSENDYYKCNGEVLKDANGNNITSESALDAWAEANGVKKYSLGNLGIKTQAYLLASTENKNCYHIDGDSDDSVSKNNTDVLMTMLNSDPDTVTGFMKRITSDLYSAIGDRMKSVPGLSSSFTIYNDIEMAQEYSDYTDTISKWEDRIENIEDSYYKKFAAMESALASLQSQSSSLTSLLS